MDKFRDYLADRDIEITIDDDGLEYMWKRHAAEAANVAERTLERHADKKSWKQVEFKRKTFYLISDLEEYAEELDSITHRATIESDTDGQTPTDNQLMQTNQSLQPNAASFTGAPAEFQQRLMVATVEKAEADARKSYLESNITFPLHEVADVLNLSIVDLKANAKTFKGKNQKLMITKANLYAYLESL